MRFAIYAVLVLVGIGGTLVGVNGISDPRTEVQAILFILTGVVALGALGIVMAIEHASAVHLAEMRKTKEGK